MNQQRRALELAQKVMQSWQGQAPVGFNEAFQAVNQALKQPADHSEQHLDMVDHGDELTIAYLDGVHTGKQLAKREWVGLTNEECIEIAARGYPRWLEFAQAVEAKLREKNGGAAQPADLSLNCKSVQARLATQWGYVRREWVDLEEIDFVGINQSCLTKMQAAEAAVRLLKEKNAQPADHCEDVLHMVRPQNCGTGYCSCIECPFKKGGK